MEKFLTKENVFIAVIVAWMLIQTNIFATRLELEQLRGEVLEQKIEMQAYSDKKDSELLEKIEQKYDKIMQKLEALNKK